MLTVSRWENARPLVGKRKSAPQVVLRAIPPLFRGSGTLRRRPFRNIGGVVGFPVAITAAEATRGGVSSHGDMGAQSDHYRGEMQQPLPEYGVGIVERNNRRRRVRWWFWSSEADQRLGNRATGRVLGRVCGKDGEGPGMG
jgi:hypothetical protein